MDNLNKTISFVLGLVVVLVFFAVITGRINLKGKLPTFGKTPTPTPTTQSANTSLPSLNKTSQADSLTKSNNNYKNSTVKAPTTIPQTGSPTLLIPILISGLGGGILLKKKN